MGLGRSPPKTQTSVLRVESLQQSNQIPWSEQCLSPKTPLETEQNTAFAHESFETSGAKNKNAFAPESSETFNDKSSKASKNVQPSEPKSLTLFQTGLDRYIEIKRKRSPQKNIGKQTEKYLKLDSSKGSSSKLKNNPYAVLLEEDENDKASQSNANKSSKSIKPPPIYLREQSSNQLVSNISSIIGDNFYIVPIRKGNISETKIEISSENHYRTVTAFLDKSNKNYYTYQLKSSKGLAVVIKGIEADVDTTEIKEALEESGFLVKSVFNLRNRDKVPQPMFKVELEPDCRKLKANECHPIYNLRYLLHRRINVDEPHKRSGPIQCMNCQEYGHTKAYCTLKSVCVICGEFHPTKSCPTDRSVDKNKKCSNCGGPHTANYRGCPVYIELRDRTTTIRKNFQESRKPQSSERNIDFITKPNVNYPQPLLPPTKSSYADVLKGQPTNNEGIGTMITNLMACMTQFMTSMQSMIQDFMKNQNQLMQILISKQ